MVASRENGNRGISPRTKESERLKIENDEGVSILSETNLGVGGLHVACERVSQ